MTKFRARVSETVYYDVFVEAETEEEAREAALEMEDSYEVDSSGPHVEEIWEV